MAISIKDFQDDHFTVLRGRAEKIMEFFSANKDKAFTSREIAEAVESNAISVTPILKRLAEKDLIERKSPYFAFKVRNDKNKPKQKVKDDEKESGDELSAQEIIDEDFDEPQTE